MWLTGFDVKCLATLYLDKPMQGHTLMQAIARVNRVGGGKKHGLIIDYNGMIKSLRRALATFAQGDRAGTGKGEAELDTVRDDAEALPSDAGVLCAPTAFGKTVTAAAMIARRGVNTLVLVHRTELLKQWQERLQAFLGVGKGVVGTIGGGKAKPTGRIDSL